MLRQTEGFGSGRSIFPFIEHKSSQFSFEGGDCLYVDPHGRRVLADWEGSGTFQVLTCPNETSFELDELAQHLGEGVFSTSFMAASSSPGISRIVVSRGEPFEGGKTIVSDSFSGCGWVLESKDLCLIDGQAVGKPLGPSPVFIEARGLGMVISPVPGRLEPLSRLNLDEPESLRAVDWKVKNASNLFGLTSGVPGGGTIHRKVLSHLNGASLRIKKPLGCSGILLRKLYDAFHGRQPARVLVDGKFVCWWYEPVEDRQNRWRWAQVGLQMPEEARDLLISIDPPAGSPLWSVSEYEIYGYFAD